MLPKQGFAVIMKKRLQCVEADRWAVPVPRSLDNVYAYCIKNPFYISLKFFNGLRQIGDEVLCIFQAAA